MLFSFFVMAADSGLKNLQRSNTKCWGTEAVNVEDQRTFCVMNNLRIREKQDTHRKERQREREIGTKRRYIPIATVTKDNSNKLN